MEFLFGGLYTHPTLPRLPDKTQPDPTLAGSTLVVKYNWGYRHTGDPYRSKQTKVGTILGPNVGVISIQYWILRGLLEGYVYICIYIYIWLRLIQLLQRKV